MNQQAMELGEKLTAAEREALDEAVLDDQDRVRGYRVTGPGGTAGDSPTIYEVVARIAADRQAAAWDEAVAAATGVGLTPLADMLRNDNPYRRATAATPDPAELTDDERVTYRDCAEAGCRRVDNGTPRSERDVDERLLDAFQDAGLNESDAQVAFHEALIVLAADLWETAHEAEWAFRSMTFYRTGDADMQLHPIGQWLRDRYASAFLGVALRATRQERHRCPNCDCRWAADVDACPECSTPRSCTCGPRAGCSDCKGSGDRFAFDWRTLDRELEALPGRDAFGAGAACRRVRALVAAYVTRIKAENE